MRPGGTDMKNRMCGDALDESLGGQPPTKGARIPRHPGPPKRLTPLREHGSDALHIVEKTPPRKGA